MRRTIGIMAALCAGGGIVVFTAIFLAAGRDTRGVVLQQSAHDCAPAAATMLLQDLSVDATYDDVRSVFRLGPEGASLGDIVTALRVYGIQAEAWMLDPSTMGQYEYPMILHTGDRHMIVLDSVRKGQAYVRDPASGRRVLTMGDLRADWSGAAVVVRQP